MHRFDRCGVLLNDRLHSAATLRDISKDAAGKKLGASQRHGVVFPMADALAGLMAAKSFHADVKHLALTGGDHPVVGPELESYLNTFNDLLGTIAGNVAGEAARVCAEVVFGFNAADAENGNTGIFQALHTLLTKQHGADAEKQAEFCALRAKVDASLAGTKIAKDNAAKCLTTVMIPEALDYPM